MSTDAAERRLTPRIPSQAELQVLFARNENAIPAHTGNISPSGMEFRVPWNKERSRVGEEVLLRFALPGREDVTVRGLICHERLDEGAGLKQFLSCGVKFLDLTGENWRLIQSYCQARTPTAGGAGPAGNLDDRAPFADLTKKMRKGRPIGLEILANLIMADGRIVQGRIEDAGFGGLEIGGKKEITPGTQVKVRVIHEHIHAELEGMCAWSRRQAEGREGYLHGIRIGIPDKTQFEMLRDLILKLVRSAR